MTTKQIRMLMYLSFVSGSVVAEMEWDNEHYVKGEELALCSGFAKFLYHNPEDLEKSNLNLNHTAGKYLALSYRSMRAYYSEAKGYDTEKASRFAWREAARLQGYQHGYSAAVEAHEDKKTAVGIAVMQLNNCLTKYGS
ncbi:hypothetical protein [Vibrio sp. M260118]|uniref:hypothetical protein n=1 Tax=Vibrio sp. M260118 TaxID=3020896 RepID=UPI002F3F1C59